MGGFFDGFVEGFRWGVAVFSQDIVLSQEHTVDTTHQTTSFTVQVRVDFSFESGLVDVTRTDGDSQGLGLFVGLTGDIVPDGVGRVDTTTFLEQRSDGSTGTLWSNQDDIQVLWWFDVGQVLEDWGETVGEVQSLTLGQQWLDSRPCFGLSSIGQQVHDVVTLLDGIFDGEQVLAWDPTVFDGSLPRGTVLTDTDDDVQTVVSQVQTLAVTLGTVTDQGESVVLEVVQQLLSWPVSSFVDSFDGTTEVDLLQTTGGDHWLNETGSWSAVGSSTGGQGKGSLSGDDTGVTDQSGGLSSQHFVRLFIWW